MGMAWCHKCKKKVDIFKAFIRPLANNRVTEQGQCPKCRTNISRFLNKAEANYLKEINREVDDGESIQDNNEG